jgi:sec-independent protein translocase protein TatA
MPQVGPAEILVILLVGLLVFGPKRLPEIGRQVGRAMREVRQLQETVKGELDQVLHGQDEDRASAPSYSPTEPSISVPDEPPALPRAGARPAPQPAPAPRAQSRFRTPEPASRNGAAPNGTTNGAQRGDVSRHGSRGAPTHPAVPARPGARPPSRFRAPGPPPTT